VRLKWLIPVNVSNIVVNSLLNPSASFQIAALSSPIILSVALQLSVGQQGRTVATHSWGLPSNSRLQMRSWATQGMEGVSVDVQFRVVMRLAVHGQRSYKVNLRKQLKTT